MMMDRASLTDDAGAWYCLICDPVAFRRRTSIGRAPEPSWAEQVLTRKRFRVLIPASIERRRVTRYRSKRHRLASLPALPGYVFVRPGPGCVGLWRALSLPFVRGVLCYGGGMVPAEIPHAALSPVLSKCRVAPDAHEHMPMGQEYEVGDVVRILDEAFAGLSAQVTAIDGGDATIRFMMFGQMMQISAPLHRLGAVS